MVCTKEMCAMRVKFSRKPESLEIRHIFFVFFFLHICVQDPKHSSDFQKDMLHLHLIVRSIVEMRRVRTITMAQTDGEELVMVVRLDLKTEG